MGTGACLGLALGEAWVQHQWWLRVAVGLETRRTHWLVDEDTVWADGAPRMG